MANSKRFLALVLSAGAIGVGAYCLTSGDGEDAAGTKRLVNQVWIERLPESRRDMIGHLALVRHERGRIGVVGKSSQWRHFIELFEWNLDGSTLELHFPQEQTKGQVSVRTWNCRNEAPDPFEICLEISAKGGKRIYYSRKDWVIDVDDVDGSMADLAENNPELAGVFDSAAADTTMEELDMEVAQSWPEGGPAIGGFPTQ